MKSFLPIVVAVLGPISNNYPVPGYAVSCQSQGGSCHDGDRDCPAGTRSVFWDEGCSAAFWPWEEDDKCCA
ncbi:hypothetical protein BDW69DRAFT_198687 [Aspergillus filifer]